MFKPSLPSLHHHLAKRHPQAFIQQETSQVVLPLRFEGADFPMFFRPMEGNPTVQLMTFFPFSLRSTDLGQVARLLHLLNKELDLPGFGMDEQHQVVFYRVMIPLFEGKMSPPMLDAHIEATEKTIELFVRAIGSVIAGQLTIDQILQRASTFKATPAPIG